MYECEVGVVVHSQLPKTNYAIRMRNPLQIQLPGEVKYFAKSRTESNGISSLI